MTDSSYGSSSYGSMPPSGVQGQPARPVVGGSGMATAALVLGILAPITSWTGFGGIILGLLAGLLAVILGVLALVKAHRGLATGRGRAITGIIFGLLGIAIAVAVFAVHLSYRQDCVRDAGANQSQIQQCEDVFRERITYNP
ncbi:MAG: DUF4190 domain-containing protein [Jatrophihabitantaceae bacterium]